MLRRSLVRRQIHTAPTKPKYSDKPDMWGPQGGPPKDTIGRRWELYKFIAMNKLGRVLKPLQSPKVVWAFRKAQVRLWKGTVSAIVLTCLFLGANIWFMLFYHAYSSGPTRNQMERKVREHKISKQVISMVRERETELLKERDDDEARGLLEARKGAA